MIASTAAVTVACDLTFSLTKPFWAKLSDIFGRGIIYVPATTLILIGLSTAAAAPSFAALTLGVLIKYVGRSAANSLNTIVISDLTSTRARGFAVNFQFMPYIILPWVASYITAEIVKKGGIGWRWVSLDSPDRPTLSRLS
jgi:MFS family permease